MTSGQLRELTRADLPALQDLFERAADYFVLHEQRPPAATEAEESWDSLPSDTPRDHKHVFGWFAPELAGVAEVVRDWPQPGTWVIGLLLLDPAARGSGAGTEIVGEIDARAARAGADRLRIAVIIANARGMHFWKRLGFAQVPVHATSEQTRSASIALERPVQLEIRTVDPGDRDAVRSVRAYFAELDRRSESGFDPAAGISAEPHELIPPLGAFLVAYLRGEPVGCAGIKHHAGAPSELKRMWVADSARGRGIGRRLLAELEALARDAGAPATQLETNGALVEAIAMYRSAGYVEVPAFNDEPFAHHWFEKRLD